MPQTGIEPDSTAQKRWKKGDFRYFISGCVQVCSKNFCYFIYILQPLKFFRKYCSIIPYLFVFYAIQSWYDSIFISNYKYCSIGEVLSKKYFLITYILLNANIIFQYLQMLSTSCNGIVVQLFYQYLPSEDIVYERAYYNI